VYDEADCGSVFVAEKEGYTLVGFEGGAIRIQVWEAWAGDLAEHTSQVLSESGAQLLTAVEQSTLDGLPALRFIYRYPEPTALEYGKIAFAAFEGRLYVFEYKHTDTRVFTCDAPPLSEEAVYEHLLSTLEFDH
jgi:hypothetical protein